MKRLNLSLEEILNSIPKSVLYRYNVKLFVNDVYILNDNPDNLIKTLSPILLSTYISNYEIDGDDNVVNIFVEIY